MLSEEARKARNKYAREWRRKNPEKVQAIINRYWTRRAQESESEELRKDEQCNS